MTRAAAVPPTDGASCCYEHFFHNFVSDFCLGRARVGEETLNFTPAEGSLLLPIRGSLVLYVDQPDSIDISATGYMVEVSICTSTLRYIEVVNVEIA